MKQLTKYLALSAGLLLAATACSPKLSQQKATALTSLQDSVAYSFGVLNGQAFSEVLSRMPGDTLKRQQILAAFSDVLLGRTTKVTVATAKEIFEKYATELKQVEQRQVAAAADSLLAANKAKDGVKITESGLQYRVLRGAQGLRPTAKDTVVVQYKGTLPSGTEFDSSYKRGEPAVFPLSQVIPGWTEGICLMTKGSKYEFLIPPCSGLWGSCRGWCDTSWIAPLLRSGAAGCAPLSRTFYRWRAGLRAYAPCQEQGAEAS